MRLLLNIKHILLGNSWAQVVTLLTWSAQLKFQLEHWPPSSKFSFFLIPLGKYQLNINSMKKFWDKHKYTAHRRCVQSPAWSSQRRMQYVRYFKAGKWIVLSIDRTSKCSSNLKSWWWKCYKCYRWCVANKWCPNPRCLHDSTDSRTAVNWQRGCLISSWNDDSVRDIQEIAVLWSLQVVRWLQRKYLNKHHIRECITPRILMPEQ